MKYDRQNVIKYFWNILVGNVPLDSEIDFLSRLVLLNLMLLIGNFFIAALGIVAFIQHRFLLGGVDCVMFTMLTGLYGYLRKKTYTLQHISRLCVFLVACFYLFLFASGSANHASFLWCYTFPLLTLFILGLKTGSFANLVFLSLLFLGMFLSRNTTYIATYPTDLLIRFIPSYLTVYIFAFVWESARQIVLRRERHSKGQLQKVIAELEKAREELRELSIHDGLTGLYNRRHFNEAIERHYKAATRTQEPMALFILDLDYFKRYNDFYGHVAGDEALRQLANVLKSLVKRATDSIFRYGGEEFIIVLTNTNQATAIRMAEEILTTLREKNIPHAHSPYQHITVSIGIVLFVPEVLRNNLEITKAIDRYVEYADKALYTAKERGRNQYVCESRTHAGNSCLTADVIS